MVAYGLCRPMFRFTPAIAQTVLTNGKRHANIKVPQGPTSFNVAGQPIVCTPRDAIMTFFGCGLDYLAIEDYLVWK